MGLPKEEQDRLGYASLLSRLTSDSFQVQTGINQSLRLFKSSYYCLWCDHHGVLD